MPKYIVVLLYIGFCSYVWSLMPEYLHIAAVGCFVLILVDAVCNSIEKVGRLR
jgi:hypothetical protein